MKIYISKSNAGDFNKFLRVKQACEDAGHTVLQYTSGKYDPLLIASADNVILIGPRMSDAYATEPLSVTVGKGQAGECRALPEDETFICINGAEKDEATPLRFAHPKTIILLDDQDYQYNSKITLEEELFSITDII